MPCEIHRVIRGLDCLAHWKGTEYRTFLLYVGIVALKDHLSVELYQHFLLLFCTITILESKHFSHNILLAKAMLNRFIKCFREIYGEAYMTSNIHNLVHLVDEVAKFGELQSFSAYPFENMLGYIKKLIRSGSNPLAQVAKRISEKTKHDCGLPDTKDNKFVLTKQNNVENIPLKFRQLVANNENELRCYSKIDFGDFCLKTDSANKWFLTKKNEIACLENILSAKNTTYLFFRTVTGKKIFFEIPIKSSALNIFAVNYSADNTSDNNLLKVTDIKCKLVRVEYGTEDVFIPLLHTYCMET